MPAFISPPDYHRIKVVGSFEELVSTPFADGVNALCWPRDLPGDFREIAQLLTVTDEITTLDEARLQSLPLSEAGRIARDILLQDQQLLRARDLAPVLDCIRSGQRPVDDPADPVPTHVYSFHADSATVPAVPWLCSYNEAASEGLRNDQALRRVDVPETRAALLDLYGGQDDEDFLTFLNENYFDLHYVPLPNAQPYNFGLHNLWRIAIAHPGSLVPPCIHRAPTTRMGQESRLLLLS